GSFSPFLSPSGRFVTFLSFATNLDQGDVTPCVNLMGHECQDVFIRDRLTRTTHRLSNSTNGTDGGAQSNGASISADERSVGFESLSSTLTSEPDTNNVQDVFVAGVDPTDTAADLTGDGVLDDTVLGVLDTTRPAGTGLSFLCPATKVAVAGGSAAFL